MENLKITGKLVKKLEVETGTSKAGKEWQKQSFVIDTGAQYNPEICFQLFGEEKIQMLEKHKEGNTIEVLFNISSREYQGRYFHNVDAWAINPLKESAPVEEPVTDDLPF